MYNHVSQHNDKYCIVTNYIKLKVIGILGIHVPTYTINIKLFLVYFNSYKYVIMSEIRHENMILENR